MRGIRKSTSWRVPFVNALRRYASPRNSATGWYQWEGGVSDTTRKVPRGRPRVAVVLAGGLGTRMRRPDLPKALVPVGGRPMLARVLTGLARAGFTRTVVVVGHMGAMVRDELGGVHDGMALEYAEQASPAGTADAAACARARLDGVEAALLTWTDILVPPAHYDVLATAWRARPVAALTTVVYGNPSVGALVEFDTAMTMTGFTEKPPGVTRGWADGGVGVFDRGFFERFASVGVSPRGEKEIATALRAALAAGVPVGVEKLAGPWFDLGSPEAISRCEETQPELLALTTAEDR